MKVNWHRFDYEKKKETAPEPEKIVWIIEDDTAASLGYFDGFTFRLWTGTDDCYVSYWAEVEFPDTDELSKENA